MLRNVQTLVVVMLLAAAAFVAAPGRDAQAGIISGCPTTAAPVNCFPVIDDPGDSVIQKTWTAVPGPGNFHTMLIETVLPVYSFIEFAFNETGTPWTDYHISFAGEFPFTISTFSSNVTATIDVTDSNGVSSGNTVLSGPFACGLAAGGVQPICEFDIFFDTPLPDGSGFSLSAMVTGADFDLFIEQYPTVTTNGEPMPEPATLLLFAGGLAGLGLMRRRKRAA